MKPGNLLFLGSHWLIFVAVLAAHGVSIARASSSSLAYIGCYSDKNQRALPKTLAGSGSTVESCIALAAANGYTYAGLQYGGQCFAGDGVGDTRLASSSCDMSCTADSSETCGGAWANSVYATGSQGCYSDTSTRALSNMLLSSNATIDSCIAAAKAKGYFYAGLQNGGQCFAGDSLGYDPLAASSCDEQCTADSDQLCGGAWSNNIFSIGQPIPSSTTVPQIATQFIDAIGMNIHLSYFGTVYTSYFSQLSTLATALGVKHFRDGIPYGEDAAAETQICDNTNALMSATSAKLDLIVSPNESVGDIQSFAADCVNPRYVEALEGPNELDISTDTNWAPDDVTTMKKIDTARSETSSLASVAMVAPSIAGSNLDFAKLLSAFGASRPFTTGNGHYYFSTHNPGTLGWGGSFTVDGKSYDYGSLPYDFAFSEVVSGSDPIYMTETGFNSNTIGTTFQANYLPRALMLEYAQAPAGSRMYVYELADEGLSDGPFALIDSSAHIKPAYTSLQNLISALADPAAGNGSTVSKTPVHFAVSGDTANVDTMVLRKSSGKIIVAIWIETDEVKNGVPTPQTVTVQVETQAWKVSVTDTVQYLVFSP